MNVALVIPAGGKGERFSKDVKKQFYQLDKKPILYHTVKNMIFSFDFAEVVIGTVREDEDLVREAVKPLLSEDILKIASAGSSRAETVRNCLESTDCGWIAVHDAARPFVSAETVREVIGAAVKYGAAAAALKVRDTVKLAKDGFVTETVDRSELYLAHTPQAFEAGLLKNAVRKALASGHEITDESAAVEMAGHRVKLVESSVWNLKLTYSEDAPLFETLGKSFSSNFKIS